MAVSVGVVLGAACSGEGGRAGLEVSAAAAQPARTPKAPAGRGSTPAKLTPKGEHRGKDGRLVPAPCPPATEWPAGMACVRGGHFTRGEARGRPDEKQPIEAYVSTFYMDKYEVTNAEYKGCIEAGICAKPVPFRRFGRERQPVVAVSWFDAQKYCTMVDKRLPTEAEWEHAARGPNNTRYPWGDEPKGCPEVNVEDRKLGKGCGKDVTKPVGSFAPGHYGLYDMAGNVHEWVFDWYTPCYSGCPEACGADCSGENPKGPCDGAKRCPGRRLRSVRGGSWYWPLERARGAARRGSGAPNRGPHRFGFRCGRDL
ncbi:MAG: formylglycine-generating enzyme family protein [Polyangiales bacterium]